MNSILWIVLTKHGRYRPIFNVASQLGLDDFRYFLLVLQTVLRYYLILKDHENEVFSAARPVSRVGQLYELG